MLDNILEIIKALHKVSCFPAQIILPMNMFFKVARELEGINPQTEIGISEIQLMGVTILRGYKTMVIEF